MELQVGVKIALKNSEGKYLLLRRNQEKYPDVKDSWDIVGGRIIPGTPLIDNLKREIEEETGMELTDMPRLIAAQDILRSADKHVVRLTYTADIDGDPNLDGDHLQFKWLSHKELEQLSDLDSYFRELLSLLAD